MSVEHVAAPLLNRSGFTLALESPQDHPPVPDIRLDRLIQFRQQRLAERIPRRDQLRHEVACARKAQVVGAEIALERGTINDLSLLQRP